MREGRAIERLYYYSLHNVPNAGVYGGPATARGRGDRRRLDQGLVGTARDAEHASNSAWVRVRGNASIPQSGARRLAYCTLRARVIHKKGPRKCD